MALRMCIAWEMLLHLSKQLQPLLYDCKRVKPHLIATCRAPDAGTSAAAPQVSLAATETVAAVPVQPVGSGPALAQPANGMAKAMAFLQSLGLKAEAAEAVPNGSSHELPADGKARIANADGAQDDDMDLSDDNELQ